MATPGILLYYHPYSFSSQKVLMALHEKKIPFQTRFVNIYDGKQFSEDFLALNPRGEVPVLLDDDNIRRISGSTGIIKYLEDYFSYGHPPLYPDGGNLLSYRCDQLTYQIDSLKVEALSFGSAVHSIQDLSIRPKPPYSYESQRAKMRDALEQHRRILQTKAEKFPQYADGLNEKLRDVEREMPLIMNRDEFEGLILQFEEVMDECEAELDSHGDVRWWLVAPHITTADISLGILLFRLWQLGFEKRMWENSRPEVDRYFKRVKQLDSFKKATSTNTGLVKLIEFLKNPFVLGALGATTLFAGGFYFYLFAQGKIQNRFAEFLFGLGKTKVPPHIQGRAYPLTQPK